MKKALLVSMVLALTLGIIGCTSTTKSHDITVSQQQEMRLNILSIKATADDGNVAENVLDGKSTTRWSALKEEAITLEVTEGAEISAVNIAFSKGNERKTKFMIDTSKYGENWETVYYGMSSGITDELEKYSFPREEAKYIRITGFGNTSNQWNSLTEVEIEGYGEVSENVSNFRGSYEVFTTKEQAAEKIEAEKKDKSEVVPYIAPTSYIWEGEFTENWKTEWNLMNDKTFGMEENIEQMKENGEEFIRVSYPKGSINALSVPKGAPLGGTQFFKTSEIEAADEYELSYKVRFSSNFDFVKGGKLPGLYGGDRNASGGRIPDGKSGWSTRYMWKGKGEGEVYTYMPSNTSYGASLGRGEWTFIPGKWHEIVQRVKLNTVGEEDGLVEVYFDGKLVHRSDKLVFRTVDTLKIDGLFFSTFFGGSNPSWASTADVYTDFKNFKIAR